MNDSEDIAIRKRSLDRTSRFVATLGMVAGMLLNGTLMVLTSSFSLAPLSFFLGGLAGYYVGKAFGDSITHAERVQLDIDEKLHNRRNEAAHDIAGHSCMATPEVNISPASPDSWVSRRLQSMNGIDR